MVYRRRSVHSTLFLGAVLLAGNGFGQISFPGQYPNGQPGGQPGGYPGQSPYPQGRGSGIPGRRSSKTTTTQEEQLHTVSIAGVLRRISDSDMVVEADDKRILTVGLGTTTKFLKGSGDAARNRDFQPGDQLTVDATQDDKGNYHARSVTQIKKGTAAERAAAAEPADDSPIADGAKGGAPTADGDDDRPRLKRSPSSAAAAAADTTPKPQIVRDDSSCGDSSNGADGPPRIARKDAAAELPPAPDPNDPGPPKLKRGAPQARGPQSRAPQAEPTIAENNSPPRPTLHAEEVNGVTKTPALPKAEPAAENGREPIQKSGDAVIDSAREAAFSFSETLPNYVVKQFTTRYGTDAPHRGQTSWRAIDTVSADVVSEGGRETYKNILVNGKAPKQAVEKSGSWSTGEFSSVLLDILSPATDADFHNKRSTSIVNRPAFRYDFSVEQPNSHWHVYASAESYRPEYTGAIWIDKESSRVLRIEMSAKNLPKAFAFDTVESSVDYDFVLIGDRKFLLPVHSEALDCARGTSTCSRNVIDFRNYKKFGADTSITFEPTPEK
jgi:hypothetical protein